MSPVTIARIDAAVIGYEALLRNKRAVARPKDLEDVGTLEAASPAARRLRSRARRRR